MNSDIIIDKVKRIIGNVKGTYISDVSYDNIMKELEIIRKNAKSKSHIEIRKDTIDATSLNRKINK